MAKKTRRYFGSHARLQINRWERRPKRTERLRRRFNELNIDEQYHAISEKYRYLDEHARQQIGRFYYQVRKYWLNPKLAEHETRLENALKMLEKPKTKLEQTLERHRNLSNQVIESKGWGKDESN